MNASEALRAGIITGWLAGVPQVALAQGMERLLSLPGKPAEIGPRFVRRLGRRAGAPPSDSQAWWLAGLFHFGYAGFWGVLYALIRQRTAVKPVLGGPIFGAIIYLLAFSPWGGATQTGSERPPHQRRWRETFLHWCAAQSFSVSLAFLLEWYVRSTEAQAVARA